MPHTRLLAPVLAAAAVLAAGMAMFAAWGLLDAVALIAVTVALAGAYRLRHFARATLIYGRRPTETIAGHAATAPDGPDRRPHPGDPGPPALPTLSPPLPGPPGRNRRRAMPNWPIRNVMTTDVITASDHVSIAEVAAILAERRISAVPIVNRFDVVVGVVSWTDLHHAIDLAEQDDNARGGWLRRARPGEVRWPDRAATEVMSAPPVTVGPDASLSAAGRLMHRHNVGRLLVTDRAGRLVGIVTRRDLLKVHARLDAVIRDDVAHRILRRNSSIEPDNVQVAVDDGVVTLTGRTGRKSTALAAVGLTEAVAGVTGVVDRLTFDTDDTVRPPVPRAPAHDRMHGWWVGRRADNEASEGPPPWTPAGAHRLEAAATATVP